jgi:raffinose/stachyose/melibiose transport system permease protein
MAVAAPTLRGATRGALLAVYALIILVPMTVVVFTTFKTSAQMYASPFGLPTSPTFASFTELLDGGRLGTSLLNSVIVTGCSVVLTLLVSTLAAFGIARIHGWLGIAIFGLFAAGLAVPAQVAMIPQYVIVKQIGLDNSLLGLIVINIAVTCPVAIFILTGFLKTLPTELFEAAEIDGAGPFRMYRSVALPLAAPSVAAVAIFLFVMHWNDLLYPLLFITDPAKATLPKALLDFKGEYTTNYPVLFAGVLVASLPMVLAYVFLQRYFVAGITAGATKG